MYLHNSEVVLLSQCLATAEPEEQSNDTMHLRVTRNKIMTAQYECYQKIMQDPVQQIEGNGD